MSEPKIPRYTVDIDEEGFPHFDGLRVQDEALLKTLIGGLHRREAGGALLTICEGEPCYVRAFDAPLVAQSVESVDADGADWVFPGGSRHRVLHAALEVDDWQRFHTWVGEHAIPAVLSRKAQAAFLHRAELARLRPRPFRDPPPQNEVDRAGFWNQVYVDGRDGWELNAPHPALEKYVGDLKEALPPPARVLVPGAGRGSDAFALAARGYRVTAVDFAEEAEKAFRSRQSAGTSIEFVRADAFEHLARNPESYDAIFEHTIYCAIHPSRRAEYLAGVRNALRQGGLYFGVFFTHTAPGGPPFGLTQWELRESTREHFEIRAWRPLTREETPGGRKAEELWAALKKKAS